MITIAVGGQMCKPQICEYIKKYGKGEFTSVTDNDLNAAMKVKSGTADYYFGCCETGAGGSLAGAIAILGYSNCASVSFPGRPPVREKIAENIKAGKKAFGFTNGNAEEAVKLLLEEIMKANKGE